MVVSSNSSPCSSRVFVHLTPTPLPISDKSDVTAFGTSDTSDDAVTAIFMDVIGGSDANGVDTDLSPSYLKC